jgi:hypothetical protein
VINYFSFVINAGGFGGFLASVLAIGTVHPPGIYVSALALDRGGGGGSFIVSGGAMKPASSEPSPAKAKVVPSIRLAINIFFILYLLIIYMFQTGINVTLYACI